MLFSKVFTMWPPRLVNLAEDVQNPVHDAIFILKLQVAVGDLDGDGSKHGFVGHADEIRAGVKGQQIGGKPGSDHRFQILEFDRGRLEDLGIKVQPGKLFHALRLAPHPSARPSCRRYG